MVFKLNSPPAFVASSTFFNFVCCLPCILMYSLQCPFVYRLCTCSCPQYSVLQNSRWLNTRWRTTQGAQYRWSMAQWVMGNPPLTSRFDRGQCSAVQCSAVQCSAIQCCRVKCYASVLNCGQCRTFYWSRRLGGCWVNTDCMDRMEETYGVGHITCC